MTIMGNRQIYLSGKAGDGGAQLRRFPRGPDLPLFALRSLEIILSKVEWQPSLSGVPTVLTQCQVCFSPVTCATPRIQPVSFCFVTEVGL